MRCLFAIFILIGGLLKYSAGLAQPGSIRFKHLSVEQGLSNSTVECIFQDDRGFIWFGTRDGLNRFDGNQMEVYRYKNSDTNSISDNYIRCISQDRTGGLWIGTSNGLNHFDPKTTRFTRYKSNPSDPYSISHNMITSVFPAANGDLWVGTWEGVNRLRPGSRKFERIYAHAHPTAAENQVNCLYQDTLGIIWVGTEKGLARFDGHTASKPFSMVQQKGSPDAVRVIHPGNQGTLWIGTKASGLYAFQPEDDHWKPYRHQEKNTTSLGSNLVRSIEIDKNGQVWVGTINGGLNALLPTEGFVQFQNDPSNPASLSQRTVSALLEDRQGNLWIGTHRGGLNVYAPARENFGLFQKETNTNSLSYNDVKCFYEDKRGKIWIGTDGGGLNEFDPVSKQFKHYKYNPFNPRSLGSNEVLHITEDSRGNLWVSTWGGGLNLLDRNTGTFTRYLHNPANNGTISSNFVQQVFEDDQQHLWVATYYGGLNLFNPDTKTFTPVHGDEQRLTHLMGKNFVSICQDSTGNLWFATDDGGLNCLDRRTQKFINYFTQEEKIPDIRVLFVDSQKRLWAGQAGLFLFNAQTRQFSVFTDRAGLSTAFIKGICEDDQGYFWIATSNGLVKLHPDSLTFKKFNTADGLQGLEFENNAYLKTRDGHFYFGGVNGFNRFHPADIQLKGDAPPVYITGLHVGNEKVTPLSQPALLPVDISYTRAITLTYKQSTISFDFAALNFSATENNQYAYRMVGLQDDWNQAGNEHKATYTNLPPGTYTFEVKAANSDGIWNDHSTSIQVEITPPFWKTWWFKLMVAAIVLSVIILLLNIKRRLEIQRIEKTKRDELHQMQLQFFTNISHEFRTPLSLIMGPLEKLQKENDAQQYSHYFQTMHRNASRLLALVNELMDFRKVESGVLKLRVMPGNLDLFLEEIEEVFIGLAEEKNIRFSVQLPGKLPQYWFDRQVVEKILINLLGNAFKYTASGGTVSITLSGNIEELDPAYSNELLIPNSYKGKEYIHIQVQDNGIGISEASIRHLFERYYKITDTHLGSGVGLAFVKSLTLLHKGHIAVYSERHKGTTFIISLPVGEADYTEEEKWTVNKSAAIVNIESLNFKHEPAIGGDIEESGNMEGPPRHILIVDDNEELRNFLRGILSEQFQVWEAADGAAGYELAREKVPDLIISDVMMPVTNGNQFCRMIKNDASTRHIPFIMLTAKSTVKSNIEGIESGADFYFSKPVNMEMLVLTIRNIFHRQQLFKDHYFKDLHADTKAQVHAAKDKEFIDTLLKTIEEHLSDPELEVEDICRNIGMSRTKLHQMVKKITGYSTTDFIRTVRLRKAVQIMTEEDVLITEVMVRVGMQTQSYFTKAFKKEFGKTPSQYLLEIRK